MHLLYAIVCLAVGLNRICTIESKVVVNDNLERSFNRNRGDYTKNLQSEYSPGADTNHEDFTTGNFESDDFAQETEETSEKILLSQFDMDYAQYEKELEEGIDENNEGHDLSELPEIITSVAVQDDSEMKKSGRKKSKKKKKKKKRNKVIQELDDNSGKPPLVPLILSHELSSHKNDTIIPMIKNLCTFMFGESTAQMMFDGTFKESRVRDSLRQMNLKTAALKAMVKKYTNEYGSKSEIPTLANIDRGACKKFCIKKENAFANYINEKWQPITKLIPGEDLRIRIFNIRKRCFKYELNTELSQYECRCINDAKTVLVSPQLQEYVNEHLKKMEMGETTIEKVFSEEFPEGVDDRKLKSGIFHLEEEHVEMTRDPFPGATDRDGYDPSLYKHKKPNMWKRFWHGVDESTYDKKLKKRVLKWGIFFGVICALAPPLQVILPFYIILFPLAWWFYFCL